MAFTPDDLEPVVSAMKRLAAAQDGWINLLPTDEDLEVGTPRLGFFALFGGGSNGVMMCTWIPGGLEHHGDALPSLGITHNQGRHVFAEIQSGPAPIPDLWRVEQDHPRRGLIIRLPGDEPPEKVLAWAIRAVGVLRNSTAPVKWVADVYMPR
ncbi:MAG: hypothetical protein ACRD0Z_13185 [Acidimicrobiales bacterium]